MYIFDWANKFTKNVKHYLQCELITSCLYDMIQTVLLTKYNYQYHNLQGFLYIFIVICSINIMPKSSRKA